MPYPSPMPEYQPLFHQVQNFIADQLNSDPQLSSIGLEFLPESQLDIEYGIKRNLGRQGMVGIVNTLKGTYGGHDQDSCAWEIESEIDVVENPTVRRAWLKQNNLSAGTTVDVLNYIQESLCGPASPTYGKFCPVTQEVGEDNGVLVGKAVLKTFAISDVSACVSGESNWHIRYATEADISALWDAVCDVSAELSGSQLIWDAIEELSGDIDNLEYNFEWAKEQIQDVIPQELSTKISYPVMEQNPYGGNEWILDPSPLDPDTPSTAKVKFGAYEESVPGLYTPYIKLGDNPYLTIDQNHIWLGRTKLVNFPDMSAAISALDTDHFIRWFATSSQPNRWIVNFGRSSTGGISFVSDSDHPTQSYIDIAGNLITAPGYDPNFQSRGLKKSRDIDDHLQFNQKGLAFVDELSAVEADLEPRLSAIEGDVSALSTQIEEVSAQMPTIWRVWEYEPGLPGLTFTAEEANSTVAMQAVGSALSVSLEYTIDGTIWQDFIVGTTIVTLPNVGDKMAMRAKTTNSGFASSRYIYSRFVMTGKIAASGSIMYLLKNDGYLDTIPSDYCFYSLFVACKSLTEAPELPATTLAANCYTGMFWNCSSLNSIKIGYTGNFSGSGVPSGAFTNWVGGVAASGTFYYNGSDTSNFGTSAIPTGWTIQSF